MSGLSHCYDLGHAEPWRTLYDPARVTWRAAGEFARENLNVAKQYVDLVTPGEMPSAEALVPGSGGVLREGMKKIAIYRDAQGRLHRFSALCPHLWCVVGWNAVEKTWDCPCHGSRFDALEHVVNGPANTGLERLGAPDSPR
jgi:Rieske Fe-S protein